MYEKKCTLIVKSRTGYPINCVMPYGGWPVWHKHPDYGQYAATIHLIFPESVLNSNDVVNKLLSEYISHMNIQPRTGSFIIFTDNSVDFRRSAIIFQDANEIRLKREKIKMDNDEDEK